MRCGIHHTSSPKSSYSVFLFLSVFTFDSFEYVFYYPKSKCMTYMSFHKVSRVPCRPAFPGGYLSLKMCERNEGNKWWSRLHRSKGHFHRKYRTVWSHVIYLSVTDPAESISSLGSQRKRYWISFIIFHWVFLLSCVLHIKVENWGWQVLHLCCNFERLLLKIIAVSRRSKRFTLFHASLITCALRILFLSMVITFFIYLCLH